MTLEIDTTLAPVRTTAKLRHVLVAEVAKIISSCE